MQDKKPIFRMRRFKSDGEADRRLTGGRLTGAFSGALARAGTDGIDIRKLLARQTLPLGFAIGIVWLLWGHLDGLDLRHVLSALKTVTPQQWVLAAIFSAISFWALGRYDRVVHRLIGSPVRSGPAQMAGVTAIALSQTTGLGVLSSALVRWRMLPEVSLFQALRISMIVSISFLSAWAVIAAFVALITPVPVAGATWMATAVLFAATCLALISIARPNFLSRFNIPPLRAMAAFVILAAIDTAAAGAALWAVLPADASIALLPLIAAYLIALGAGLVSGTPGGVGPFEVTLLALLPQLEQAPLLAAILAFRTIYYAVPALIAAALTIKGPSDTEERPRFAPRLRPIDRAPNLPQRLSRMIDEAPRAETALLRHGCLDTVELRSGRPAFMAKPSGQSLICLSDPLRPDQRDGTTLSELRSLAKETYLSPFLYKIGARMALIARQNGWKTLPIAREAWIDPQQFCLDGSDRRQLRRKLRQAEKSGVKVKIGGSDLPLKDMDRIAHAWRTMRGGERGFSMGTWQPTTLPYAQVVLAYLNDQLIGFITLHKNQQEQVLDLMRLSPDAPDGTMHLLVKHAIENAARSACRRLSLAAVPLGKRPEEPALFRTLRDLLDRYSGANGLRQFKSAFAPNWETLYAAAPNRWGLLIGALDVCREISAPRPHAATCAAGHDQTGSRSHVLHE